MKKTNEEKQEFYQRCSEILGIKHEYNTPVPRRTRWNTRFIGNGRYPGFGLIRCYNSSVMVTTRIHGSRMFDDYESVYEYLVALAKG